MDANGDEGRSEFEAHEMRHRNDYGRQCRDEHDGRGVRPHEQRRQHQGQRSDDRVPDHAAMLRPADNERAGLGVSLV